jgi:hypothetical protein
MVERVTSKRDPLEAQPASAHDVHDEHGKFRRGHKPIRNGREKGVHNKITRDIKEGIIDGAVAHGQDGKGKGGLRGYLTMCATKYPKQYMYLLGKLLPFVVRNTVDASLRVQSVNVVPVQSDRYVTAEDMLQLVPQIIDVTATRNDDDTLQ